MPERTCLGCLTPLIGAHTNRLYCTDRCKWRARTPGKRPTQPCALCDGPMPVFPGRTSPVGVAAHNACRRNRPGYRNRAVPPTQAWDCARCGATSTRLTVRGNLPKLCVDCRPSTGAGVTLSVRKLIYERDQWNCGICHEPVDASLIGTRSPWRPSLDHVVPYSQGGTSDPSNLRLAHMWCNCARGAGRYQDEDFRHDRSAA